MRATPNRARVGCRERRECILPGLAPGHARHLGTARRGFSRDRGPASRIRGSLTWPVLATCSIPISSLNLIKHPTGAVARHIAKVGEDAICTSIVVACKLRYGAAKKGSPVLSDKIGQLLSTIEVLPLEEGADEKYAEVRTALERAGTLIGANDLLIATRALSLGLALVTDNAGEFSRVPGLRVENWLAP
jgi:tRNA(fMet)-specific endonuclease VapC